MDNYDIVTTCDTCDGSGVKYDYELDGRPCTKCNGTGKIPLHKIFPSTNNVPLFAKRKSL